MQIIKHTNIYDKTVIALVHTLSGNNYVINEPRFIFDQCQRMPDHMGFAIRILTIIFALWALVWKQNLFHCMSLLQRKRILDQLRASRIGICRDFIRFYQTLTVFCVCNTEEWL
jgi:hypothetical protein